MKRLMLLLALLWALPAAAQIMPPSPQFVNAVSSGVTVCTSGNCATWTIPNSNPSTTMQITGTMTSMTLTFEATADGQTWFTVGVRKLSDGSLVTTTTGTGQFAIPNSGIVGFRARCTTYASGGANVSLTRGVATASASLGGASLPGSFTVGDLLTANSATTLTNLPDVAVGQVLVSGGVGVVPAYTASPSVTGTVTSSRAGLATTSTDGLIAVNPTAATALATVQISPRIRLTGTAWNTSASVIMDFVQEVIPATAATPTATWNLKWQRGGGGFTNVLSADTSGDLSVARNVSATGSLIAGAAGLFFWNTKEVLQSPADGLLSISQNSTATVGVQMNTGTAVPTVANCSVGSAGSISVHSSNTAGEVNTGSGSTSCDVVFGTPAYSFAPFCTITDETSVILAPRISARATTGFTVTGLTAGDKFLYVCLGGAF